MERTLTCDVESLAGSEHVAAWAAAKEGLMFDKFTDRARKALGEARNIAVDVGIQTICPEHLLLALLRDRDGIAARSLAVRCDGFDLGQAQDELLGFIKRRAEGFAASSGSPGHHSAQVPHGPSLKRCFNLAVDAAHRLKNNYIGTEHLLLGLVENYDYEPTNAALEKIGLTRSRVASAVMEELKAQTDPTPTPLKTPRVAGTASSTDEESSLRVDVAVIEGQDRKHNSTFTTSSVPPPDAPTDDAVNAIVDALVDSFRSAMIQALKATADEVKADFVIALGHAKAAIESAKITFPPEA